MTDEITSLETLANTVLDIENNSVDKRTRAVFYLRTRGQREDLDVLLKALLNKADSELMRHEIAYVIGQFRDAHACEVLEQIVQDEDENLLVRHEAAEALGAIGHEQSLQVIEKFCDHSHVELAETCQLTRDLIEYKTKEKNGQLDPEDTDLDPNPYRSEDPAPGMPKKVPTSELRELLLDESKPLFDRYRAMFSLRNRNTTEAALALSEGFQAKSALFRHEVAYVMGQMENATCAPALIKVVENLDEHRMVRHEAAESLGAIGTPECQQVLQRHLNDPEPVVSESCQVGLDALDYWSQAKQEYPQA